MRKRLAKEIGGQSGIANAVLFLLSDKVRVITGTQLIVDDGMTFSN